MDKYEFNIKVEQIKKLVNKGDYETAMKIADAIDWRRVRSTSLLTMVAQVYERNAEYQEAKDILLLAFERAPIGKGLLFKLTDLALREGNVQEAEAYYREFCEQAGDDPRQFLLWHLILEAREAPLEQQIATLERYCQEDLDEKWLYRLAELYRQAGRDEDCVQICDKIMLLFGLGKYVDKAMELKQQFAPLSEYQMDLVENREKYEEKLRAVEEEYQKPANRRLIQRQEYYNSEENEMETGRDTSGAEMEAILHEARAKEELAREMSKLEPYGEEEAAGGGETRVFSPARDVRPARQPLQAEEDSQARDWPEQAIAQKEASATAEPLKMSADVDKDMEPSSTASPGEYEEQPGPYMEEPAAYEEPDAYEQPDAYEELQDTYEEQSESYEDEISEIEDWDLALEDRYHLMLEAVSREDGIAMAVECLKSIHREMGRKNPVAKVSGDKLNRKGLYAVAERLPGKDLIIEGAADLDSVVIDELDALIDQDQTGIVLVLFDTPPRLQQMYMQYPDFAQKFRYIQYPDMDMNAQPGEEQETARETEMLRMAAAREEEAARQRLAAHEEEIRRQARSMAEAEAASQALRQAEYEASRQARREDEYEAAEEARRKAEYEAAVKARREAEYGEDEEARRQAEYEVSKEARRARYEASRAARRKAEDELTQEIRRRTEDDAAEAARYQAEKEADEAIYQEEYRAEQMRREADEEAASLQERYEEDASDDGYSDYAPQEGEPDDGTVMDVEEFTQYACKYASEIDCSITGKSLLALYERVEMMEEDGAPLTRTSAEDLIEEAADRAEKKSFGGLFSPKYDKEGLLILKEKHFFDS